MNRKMIGWRSVLAPVVVDHMNVSLSKVMRNFQAAGRALGVLRRLFPVGLRISASRGWESLTLERAGLVARLDRAWPADPQFLQEWAALQARAPSATVFNSPGWQRAVTDEHFVAAGRLRIMTVRRDNELLAVFPLALSAASVLETPGKWVSDYLDPLIDPAAAGDCWPLILDLLNDNWDWSTRGLVLHNIAEMSAARTILKAIAPDHGLEYLETVVDSTPYLQLPETWEKYLAMLSPKQRRAQKTNIRKAETEGQARWLTLSTMQEIEPALQRGLAAMRQAEGAKGQFSREFLCGFLSRVVPAIVAQGDFYMHELWLGDKPAAWHFLLRSREGPMGYNCTFDAAQRNWSPGSTSFAMAIRSSIEAKFPKYNFLRGAEEYKARFGCQSIDLMKISLLRKSRR
jgi:CelD/BcsL family acetyltransferase involved in cellulose biosynthesis